MQKLNIRQLRNIQLEILTDIDRFCQEHEINYSLCGGTLLGAVRHKGYIPWDDDIDIMMVRPDYERFMSLYVSEDNYMIDFSKEKGYRETFVKICRKDTLMVDQLLQRTELGINIDLFPIDGVPSENPQAYVQNIVFLKERIARFCPYYKLLKQRKIKMYWLLKFMTKRLINLNFKPILKLKSEFNDILKSNNFIDSKYAGVISGSYGVKEIVNKDVFLNFELLEFEGRKFSAISNYDEYLSSIYGDYMVLPPMDKRYNPHCYDAFLL